METQEKRTTLSLPALRYYLFSDGDEAYLIPFRMRLGGMEEMGASSAGGEQLRSVPLALEGRAKSVPGWELRSHQARNGPRGRH